MKTILLASLALALSATATMAQERAAPTQTADARAYVDGLIAKAGAADLFENVSKGAQAEARHTRSGLVCSFMAGGDARQQISIFPTPVPRGDDVACQLPSDHVGHTIYATRIPQVTSLDQAMGFSVGMIRSQYPDVKPFTGPAAEVAIQRDDLKPPPAHHTARFILQAGDKQYYTRVSVAYVDGWIIKHRYTAPNTEQDRMIADLMSGMAFSTALLRLTNPDFDLSAKPPAKR